MGGALVATPLGISSMKKYIYMALIVVMTNQVYCQKYYPTNKSNLWFYNLSGSESVRKVSVKSDSLFQNGKHYAVISIMDLIRGQYVRTDSDFVYYYDTILKSETPFFALKGKVGDRMDVSSIYYLNVRVTKIDSTIMFNEKTHTISYLLGSMTITEVTLSDKFGITSVSFYDDPPAPWPRDVYTLAGCVINGKTFGNVVSVREPDKISDTIELYQNYPNPFNPVSTIAFRISKRSNVVIKVLDILGREIETLLNEERPPGKYSVVFNGRNLASGVYFYQLITNGTVITKKLALMK